MQPIDPRAAPFTAPLSPPLMRGSGPNQVTAGHDRPASASQDAALLAAAQQLEAGFLAEMLGAAGLGDARETFGGGAGEEQFGSFLRQAQAEEMVRAGGIGLAETLFEAMKARDDA